ncbi:MAG TPA: fibronectin type III domain-containing protein [Terriglobales bacterium]
MKKIFPLALLGVVTFVGLIGFSIFSAKTKPHSVTLTWQAPVTGSGAKVTRYYIYRSTSRGGPYVKIGSSTGLKYEDHIVQSGRMYSYVVSAVDDHDRESKKSNETTAMIP